MTITNVGLESVADYTCVAVNAGGVMEEAITLTFEEPEPVRYCKQIADISKNGVNKQQRIRFIQSNNFLFILKSIVNMNCRILKST